MDIDVYLQTPYSHIVNIRPSVDETGESAFSFLNAVSLAMNNPKQADKDWNIKYAF